MYNVSMYMYSVIAVQTAIKQAKLEVDGEPVGDCLQMGPHVRTCSRTDGHRESVMPRPSIGRAEA